jgi:hypothetical protein
MTKLDQLQLAASPHYRNFEDSIRSPDTHRSCSVYVHTVKWF